MLKVNQLPAVSKYYFTIRGWWHYETFSYRTLLLIKHLRVSNNRKLFIVSVWIKMQSRFAFTFLPTPKLNSKSNLSLYELRYIRQLYLQHTDQIIKSILAFMYCQPGPNIIVDWAWKNDHSTGIFKAATKLQSGFAFHRNRFLVFIWGNCAEFAAKAFDAEREVAVIKNHAMDLGAIIFAFGFVKCQLLFILRAWFEYNYLIMIPHYVFCFYFYGVL